MAYSQVPKQGIVATGDRAELSAKFHAEDVVRLIERDVKVERNDAEVLFAELKLFLLSCAGSTERKRPTKRIDMAWHCFILCTREYQEYCTTVLGTFIHHVPRFSVNRPGPTDAVTGACEVSGVALADCTDIVQATADCDASGVHEAVRKADYTSTILTSADCDASGVHETVGKADCTATIQASADCDTITGGDGAGGTL